MSTTKDDVIYLIRWSAQIDAERIQCIVDGAVLAVQQIQDKRIDLLEQGPEVSASDFIFDAFVTFVLETNLIGLLARAASQRIVIPLLRRAGAATLLPPASTRREYREALNFARQFGTLTQSQVKQANPVSREALRAYHAYMRAAAKVIPEAFIGAANVAADVSRPKTSTITSTDSPGVAVLKAAQSYAASHRAAIAMTHAQLEIAAAAAKDSETLAQLERAVEIDPLELDLFALRERYALLYEAAIWTMLFGLADGSKIRARGGLLDGGRNVQFKGVPLLLMSYWEQRFASLITEWVQLLEKTIGPARMKLGPGIDHLKEPFESTHRDKRASYVHQFLIRVARELPRLPDGAWSSTLPVPKKK